ncbi:hypothetical protein [Mobiluncus sp.]|uniref:hypothetical protein n=1 Tax=Mobiluncus sp. TaxID=47293 RepID=UPI002A90994D|nr:hypothetical protein [Mobiluncus sp.]MDY6077480.1 hypothetical protein [Mobiluncus sp.]
MNTTTLERLNKLYNEHDIIKGTGYLHVLHQTYLQDEGRIWYVHRYLSNGNGFYDLTGISPYYFTSRDQALAYAIRAC